MTATTPLDAAPDAIDARGASNGRPSARSADRNAGLDLLRAIACLLVVFFHLHRIVGIDFGPLNAVFSDGDTGVWIFFALSGYLLYRPFLLGQVELRGYALKRAARILPGYFIAVASLAVLTGSRTPIDHLPAYLTMTASYDIATRDFLGNAWTLSAEILFYLALPFVARFVAAAPLPRLAILALVSVGANLGFYFAFSPQNEWLWGAFPFVFYAFVPGMILAVIEVNDPATFRRFDTPWAPFIGAVLIFLQMQTHGNFFVAIGTGVGSVLLIGWLRAREVPFPRALAFLGGASYAMYLWHQDMLESFGMLGLLLALAGSAASWAFAERPILELAHRIAAGWRGGKPGPTTSLRETARTIDGQSIDVQVPADAATVSTT